MNSNKFATLFASLRTKLSSASSECTLVREVVADKSAPGCTQKEEEEEEDGEVLEAVKVEVGFKRPLFDDPPLIQQQQQQQKKKRVRTRKKLDSVVPVTIPQIPSLASTTTLEPPSNQSIATQKPHQKYICIVCSLKGTHFSNNCDNPHGSPPDPKYLCVICKVPGHHVKWCPVKRGGKSSGSAQSCLDQKEWTGVGLNQDNPFAKYLNPQSSSLQLSVSSLPTSTSTSMHHSLPPNPSANTSVNLFNSYSMHQSNYIPSNNPSVYSVNANGLSSSTLIPPPQTFTQPSTAQLPTLSFQPPKLEEPKLTASLFLSYLSTSNSDTYTTATEPSQPSEPSEKQQSPESQSTGNTLYAPTSSYTTTQHSPSPPPPPSTSPSTHPKNPHPKPACRFFSKPGGCTSGALCRFSHTPSTTPCAFHHLHPPCTNPSCAYSHAELSAAELHALREEHRVFKEVKRGEMEKWRVRNEVLDAVKELVSVGGVGGGEGVMVAGVVDKVLHEKLGMDFGGVGRAGEVERRERRRNGWREEGKGVVLVER
ncbi:hypothetical protein BCR33DRAFT_780999 [Rhizoclosmatium globosum]|uniref:C3H1-type domain-containing protein n=1 Tax=Rhizoclosmatium globosum TaxID=329046 RepID=A0A1Y2CTQ7_9FUNG|nr:hypothetical protein BCR33DRAFT_780999 [Rhizoclosmatium globosum]|eukprot:ORY50224.1 hypothetical protein BCR33DRAFT_780999 [Rhizoclosmatium globosum]